MMVMMMMMMMIVVVTTASGSLSLSLHRGGLSLFDSPFVLGIEEAEKA